MEVISVVARVYLQLRSRASCNQLRYSAKAGGKGKVKVGNLRAVAGWPSAPPPSLPPCAVVRVDGLGVPRARRPAGLFSVSLPALFNRLFDRAGKKSQGSATLRPQQVKGHVAFHLRELQDN